MIMVLLIDKSVNTDSIAQFNLLIKSLGRLAPSIKTLEAKMKATANHAPSAFTVRDMAIQRTQWKHVQKALFVHPGQLIQVQILSIFVHVGINVLPVESLLVMVLLDLNCVLGQSECIACPEGSLCIFDEAEVDCPGGWTCESATEYNSVPCLPGEYDDGTGCVASEPGKYSSTIGAVERDLQLCDAGYYCEAGSHVGWPDDSCNAGDKNWDDGSDSIGNVCEAGKECERGEKTLGGRECESGSYAPDDGMDSCVQCPDGYNCDATKADHPNDERRMQT